MTKFEKLEVLPTTLYKFTIPESIWSTINKEVKNIDWEQQATRRDDQSYFGLSTLGKASLHKQNNWKEIVEYIEKKLEEVVSDIGYSGLEELKVCLMWANKSNLNEWHHRHIHPWSILSGIIYVEGEEGKTWFSRETDYRQCMRDNKILKLGLDPNTEDKAHIIYKHKPINKTMLIFPSTLEHSVDNNKSSTPRITLSFNTFPSGNVGNIDKLCGLNLTVN